MWPCESRPRLGAGDTTLAVDMVRESIAWYSDTGKSLHAYPVPGKVIWSGAA